MNTTEFLISDLERWLFPLKFVGTYAQLGESTIRSFIHEEVLSKAKATSNFLQCPIEYALKDAVHLRRTLVLDPIATFFLYDFVAQNRKHFAAAPEAERQSYGYAFRGEQPVDSLSDYHKLRKRRYKLAATYRYFAKVDIANCFNSFYHHDVAGAVQQAIGNEASEQIGQFLREINAGTSVNCFPQGFYPAKVIGAWFLSFIENSMRLKSPVVVRFIDDIYLFSNSRPQLHGDIIELQRILGGYSLALNAEKTHFGSGAASFADFGIDNVRARLMKIRELQSPYDNEDEVDPPNLDEAQLEYLRSRLTGREVAEQDVELALSLVRDDCDILQKLIQLVVGRHPHLLKSLYLNLGDLTDTQSEFLWNQIESRVSKPAVTGHELFWLSRLVLDRFELSSASAQVIQRILEHSAATGVVRAAILEDPSLGFGLREIKVESLRNDPTSLAGMAAMVGLRGMAKAQRNQQYKYAARTSRQLRLLAGILEPT